MSDRRRRDAASASPFSAKGDGPELKLSDRAEISSDELKFRGKQSSLTLDQTAALKGDAISFGKGDPLSRAKETPPTEETISFNVRLHDLALAPYAGKRYELRAHGKTFEGISGGDGSIAEQLPVETKIAEIEIWTGDYPTGPRRSYSINVDAIDDIDTPIGIRTRLNHLGYLQGKVDDRPMDYETANAIRRFQKDSKLETTGTIDEATKAALAKRHGH